MITAIHSPPISAQTSVHLLPETRGYYLGYAEGMTPEGWRRELEWAARAGFNLVLFPVYLNGFTLFPSKAAASWNFDRIHPLFRDSDPLADVLDLARDLGLTFWGFIRPHNFHPRYSLIGHRLLKRFPDWRLTVHPTQRLSPLRRRESRYACPLNVTYRRYLADVLTEMVGGYPLDGLVMNYTGYGLRRGPLNESPYCYCRACNEKFYDEVGENLEEVALQPGGILRIHEWQTEASTETLDYVRHRISKERRTLRFLCRAQPQWRWTSEDAGPDLYRHYCLDWSRLLDTGTVQGLVIDHDEEVDPEAFSPRLVTDLSELHHEALLLPSVHIKRPDDLGPPLEAVRRYPVSGFLAEFHQTFSDETADMIREKYFSEPAQIPEASPLNSVANLCIRIQSNHSDNPIIRDLMRDFLRLIYRNLREGADFELLQVIHENLGGLQDAIRRNRMGAYRVPEGTLRDIALARRIVRLASMDVRV